MGLLTAGLATGLWVTEQIGELMWLPVSGITEGTISSLLFPGDLSLASVLKVEGNFMLPHHSTYKVYRATITVKLCLEENAITKYDLLILS